MGAESLPALPARLCLPHVHADARLLHPAARLRPVGVAGRTGKYHVGILVLFLHPYLSRTHLEIHHSGLRAAHLGGYRAGLSWEIAMGRYSHSPVRGTASHLEPRTDVLLLLLRHPLLRGSLLRESMAHQDAAPVLQGKCRTDCGSPRRHSRQRLQPLPYVYLRQGNHARQERTGADR